MKFAIWAKGISACMELILAIPIIGGLIVVSGGWHPLIWALTVHFVTLVICAIEKKTFKSSAVGMVGSLLAFIPILGWFCHFISMIVLFISTYYTYKAEKA